MKIQLQSLRVINCGPLRDVCIHFNTTGDSPTTVLAGANGSGKTTALELIVGLAEMLLPNSELPPVRPALARAEYAQLDWLVDGERFSLFHGNKPSDASLAGNSFGRVGQAGSFRNQKHGHLPALLRAQVQKQEVELVDLNDYDGRLGSIDGNNQVLPSILYFPHTRSLLPITGDQIYKETTPYQWVYFYQIAMQFKGSLDSYLIWLEYVDAKNYAAAIQFLDELDIEGKTFSVSRRDLKAVVTTPDGGTHFLAGMSSGEQNILIMLLELCRRLLPHSIVLIDEIENSLHQAFQKKLAQALKRMQELVPFQLIVTTHSIPIVESFGPASVRILTEF